MMIVEYVCSGEDRRKRKISLAKAEFSPGGVIGDSHFGLSEREVSLLRKEDVSSAEKEAGFTFPPGSLAENLVISGLPDMLELGSVLEIGPVRLLVLERGKRKGEPHSYDYRGWCLLPKVGYFLRVLDGGTVRPGDIVRLRSGTDCDSRD